MPADKTPPQKPAASPPQPPAAGPGGDGAPPSSSGPLNAEAQRLADEAAEQQRQADEAAAEAQKALEAAEAQKALEAAEDDDAPGKVQRCPHCRTPMVKHDDANPWKSGCWHCGGCGTCWAKGLKKPRAGTPAPAGWKD